MFMYHRLLVIIKHSSMNMLAYNNIQQNGNVSIKFKN